MFSTCKKLHSFVACLCNWMDWRLVMDHAVYNVLSMMHEIMHILEHFSDVLVFINYSFEFVVGQFRKCCAERRKKLTKKLVDWLTIGCSIVYGCACRSSVRVVDIPRFLRAGVLVCAGVCGGVLQYCLRIHCMLGIDDEFSYVGPDGLLQRICNCKSCNWLFLPVLCHHRSNTQWMCIGDNVAVTFFPFLWFQFGVRWGKKSLLLTNELTSLLRFCCWFWFHWLWVMMLQRLVQLNWNPNS